MKRFAVVLLISLFVGVLAAVLYHWLPVVEAPLTAEERIEMGYETDDKILVPLRDYLYIRDSHARGVKVRSLDY